MTGKAITKTSKVTSSLNRNISPDVSKVQKPNIVFTYLHFKKNFSIPFKTLMHSGHDVSKIYIFHLLYKAYQYFL